jgi:hypothetical protein
MSRIRHLATALLAVLAAPVLAVAVAIPASAATGNLCNANGQRLCLDVSSFANGLATFTTTGNGRTITGPSAGTQGTMRYTNGGNTCLRALDNTYNVVNGPCSGVTGILWQNLDNGDGTRTFKNVHFSSRVMVTDNIAGDPWVACPSGCSPGYTWVRMQPLS